MKTLIINASPRRNGIIHRMMQEASSGAGGAVEVADLYGMKIKPCIGCMKCRESGICVMSQDDGHVLAEKIKEADLLVIGSPTYWGNMSGVLKIMFDRMVPIFMKESRRGIPVPQLKGKRAVVVVSCTTPYPFNVLFRQSNGAVRAIREVLKTGGYKVRSIEIPGTKPMTEIPSFYYRKLHGYLKADR